MADPVVILSFARTPMGGFQGCLSGVGAIALGSAAVRAAVERAGVAGNDVDQIIMGCVLPAGLGQAPARQAAIGAGLPLGVTATTVNKMCGSGMQAAIMAVDMLVAGALAGGSADIVVAGGMGEHVERAVPARQAPRQARGSATTWSRTRCTSTGWRTRTTPAS